MNHNYSWREKHLVLILALKKKMRFTVHRWFSTVFNEKSRWIAEEFKEILFSRATMNTKRYCNPTVFVYQKRSLQNIADFVWSNDVSLLTRGYARLFGGSARRFKVPSQSPSPVVGTRTVSTGATVSEGQRAKSKINENINRRKPVILKYLARFKLPIHMSSTDFCGFDKSKFFWNDYGYQ